MDKSKKYLIILAIVFLIIVIYLVFQFVEKKPSEKTPLPPTNNTIVLNKNDNSNSDVNPIDVIKEGAHNAPITDSVSETKINTLVTNFVNVYYSVNSSNYTQYFPQLEKLTTKEMYNKLVDGSEYGIYSGAMSAANISTLVKDGFYSKLIKINNIEIVSNNRNSFSVNVSLDQTMINLEGEEDILKPINLKQKIFLDFDKNGKVDIISSVSDEE